MGLILSMLTPTRGRPDHVKRYIDSIFATADDPSRIELLFYVDNDDPELKGYIHLAGDYTQYKEYPFKKVTFIFDEPKSVSKSWNDIAALSQGDVLCMGNDDIIYQEKSWDTRVDLEVAAYTAKHTDRIFCMWFDCGIKGSEWPTFPMISREWYNVLGYFAPGRFHFFYNDTWVGDIGWKIGRMNYIAEPKYMEHRHHSTNPGVADATTKHSRRDNAARKDAAIWEETSEIRQEEANKLLAYIAEQGGMVAEGTSGLDSSNF